MDVLGRKTTKTRIEGILESILRRASYDKAFRSLALSDPEALLQKYGVKLPNDSKIRFVESGHRGDEHSIPLPPLMKISLEDEDLKVIVGEKELSLARYENWSADRISKLFGHVMYENWGSE